MSSFQPLNEDFFSRSLFECFNEKVKLYPNKLAIISNGASLTYLQLLENSFSVSNLLIKDLEPNEAVSVLVPQGPAFLTTLIGCIAAGNPYIPLDPNYPIERLRLMIEVAKTKIIFASSETYDLAKKISGDYCKIVILDELPPESQRAPSRSTAHSWAYLLFTSGSTGVPKAVIEIHRNILHNVLRQTNALHITSADRQSLIYSCGVYGGARDIFCALMNGATLCHYPVEKVDKPAFGSWIKEHGVTIYCSVASVFRHLSEHLTSAEELKTVRIIKLGGEASRRSDIDIFKKLFPDHCVFYTGLASTETGTACQYPITKSTLVNSELLPLGYPAADIKIHLRTHEGAATAENEVGEILIESQYLSLGYLGLPEQTKEKFFEEDGRRYYRTGDLGKWDANNCLWHCGRGDKQIKIRGNRIEIGEVEAAFLRVTDISDVVVTVQKDKDDEHYLAAYITASTKRFESAEQVRDEIAALIPEFMVPTTITILDSLPRTVNGKVDRTKLPVPTLHTPIMVNSSENMLDFWQHNIKSIWQKILKIENIDIDQNFFALGGHSLKMAQVVAEIQKGIGGKIGSKEFLKKPTIRNLAIVTGASTVGKLSNIVVYRTTQHERTSLLLPSHYGYAMPMRSIADKLTGQVIASQYAAYDYRQIHNLYDLSEAIILDSEKYIQGQKITLVGYGFGAVLTLNILENLSKKGLFVERVVLLDPSPLFSASDKFPLQKILKESTSNGNEKSILSLSSKTAAFLQEIQNQHETKFQWVGSVELIQASLESQARMEAQVEQWKHVFPKMKVFKIPAAHIDLLNFPIAQEMSQIIEAESGKNSKVAA